MVVVVGGVVVVLLVLVLFLLLLVVLLQRVHLALPPPNSRLNPRAQQVGAKPQPPSVVLRQPRNHSRHLADALPPRRWTLLDVGSGTPMVPRLAPTPRPFFLPCESVDY